MDKKKILLVEDEIVIQLLCRRILSAPEFDLTIVGFVKEALDFIRTTPPRLLITDLRLPDGDGIEVILTLREVSPASKFIIITGSPTPEERLQKIRELEIEDFINKPFDVDTLMAAVKRGLEDKPCQSPKNVS
ncbi:MAG: response regulator [Elusimicrobia bacterium]|nr:response regulator [Elusimicrobiota bacterium]